MIMINKVLIKVHKILILIIILIYLYSIYLYIFIYLLIQSLLKKYSFIMIFFDLLILLIF